MEIWKDIEGYEQLYQVSNLGNVKSLSNKNNRREKILKPGSKKGYLSVILHKNRVRKNFLVHRLVAEAFLPNPNNLQTINHKDEDKTNNRVENLEWCSPQYNCNYGTRNNRVKENLINNSKLSKQVIQFSEDDNFIKIWESIREVERKLKIASQNICSCLKGKINIAGGYKWGYFEDYERIPFKVFDLEIYRKVN
jgi:hypothetical protein